MGDIGTHAFNLAEYITGLKATEICGELQTFVPDRLLDDDGAALIRYEGGARGVLMASQIAVGCENSLKIRVFGEKGGLEWRQEEPNTLILRWPDRPAEIVRTNNGYVSGISAYNFATALRAVLEGKEPAPEALDFPSAEEGVRGMRFIETIVSTNDTEEKWVKLVD